jgi:hypothetical protein
MARSFECVPQTLPRSALWNGAFPFLRPNCDTLVCNFGQAGDEPALSKEELSPAPGGAFFGPLRSFISRKRKPRISRKRKPRISRKRKPRPPGGRGLPINTFRRSSLAKQMREIGRWFPMPWTWCRPDWDLLVCQFGRVTEMPFLRNQPRLSGAFFETLARRRFREYQHLFSYITYDVRQRKGSSAS